MINITAESFSCETPNGANLALARLFVLFFFYSSFDWHKELSFEIIIEILNELGHEQKTGRQARRHVTLVRSAAEGHPLELESRGAFPR